MTVHRNRPTGADEAGQMEVNKLKNRIAFWILCFVLSATCGALGGVLGVLVFRIATGQ